MLAEKILTGSETLRKDWRVHGTTGYDFANQVAQLLVDSSAETAITKTFHRFIGRSVPFGHLLYAKKLQVMKLSLANDVDVLGNMLDRLSEQNRWYRDFTLEALSRAVRETIACFPVYRTYLAPGAASDEEDRQIVEAAIAAAKRRNPAMEESIFNFLRDVLLFRFPPKPRCQSARRAHAFRSEVSASTGPIMAKGLEDTVFYIYNRLAALNEVGGEPQQFGLSIAEFHERNIGRQRNWPATLLATSTHDTKRSEDVRARMVAISEIPELWRRSLQRWRVLIVAGSERSTTPKLPTQMKNICSIKLSSGRGRCRPTANQKRGNTGLHRTNSSVHGQGAPRSEAQHELDSAERRMGRSDARFRREEFWIHLRETNSFRSCSDREGDRALRYNQFAHANIAQADFAGGAGHLSGQRDLGLQPSRSRQSRPGRLQATSREMLGSLSTANANDLVRDWPDGRIKMFLTQRVSQFRREHTDLVQHGEYLPLTPSGTLAECCVSFARELEDQWIIVIAPRLSSHVGFPPIGERWKDTNSRTS